MNMAPPYPAFPSLRLAVAADLNRMAELGVAGFRGSNAFRYVRPKHEEFPEDAAAWYANLFRSQLLDPLTVVIVAEDWDQSGASSTGERIIVGIASWRLPEGSPHHGQFIVAGVADERKAIDRDLSQKRLDLFLHIIGDAEKTHFTGKAICDKLVVDPLYRRRGHASSMLRWGQRLCDQDGIDYGIIPSPLAKPVCDGLGYVVKGEMHVPDDGGVRGFTQSIVVYSTQRAIAEA
ncbi:hypothetical protein GGS24DRAFT_477102 [Hypoxylon argillaceum]|nr:hypothetical protein GGS24DRAFT_477102 [Hypoxylon argillaceum]